VRLLAAAFFLSLLACTPAARTTNADGRKVRVFYNNDNFAYLETCGCRISPIGGMDRRWNAMKAYPDDSRIFVDAGNLLFKSTEAAGLLGVQWQEQALGVIEAYSLLGADAVEPGPNEFALGIEKFQELAKKAKFPFISSNLYWKESGKRLLADSVIVERQGKKIGIFGLMGTDLPLPAALEARDPEAHAKKMISKLRSQGADMIIALTHQGYDLDEKLAKDVSGIDLLVGAHSQSLLQKPYEEGDTLIVQLSNQGQMLGMVEYEAHDLPKTRSNFVVADLDDNFNEGPRGLANPMKSLVAVTNIRIAEATKKIDAQIWDEQQKKDSVAGFETFITCRDCHTSQANFQESQPHAAAFLTLLAKHKETNLDCVKCHSVGLNEKGGFRSLGDAFRGDGGNISLDEIRKLAGKDFPKDDVSYRGDPARVKKDVAHWIGTLKKKGVKKAFVSVQCENCHGKMPGHPFAEFKPGKVSLNNCIKCHTPEQAPTWYSGGKLDETKANAALASMACPK